MFEKPKVGRPTDYKPEYCEALIKHMETGMSYASFAGVVRCNVDTLYNWEKLNQEFSEAKKIGMALNMHFWEKMGIAGTAGKVKNFNVTAWIFNMKNRHAWGDRTITEHEVKMSDKLVIDLSGKGFDDLSSAPQAD
jgi:hypothetical protein